MQPATSPFAARGRMWKRAVVVNCAPPGTLMRGSLFTTSSAPPSRQSSRCVSLTCNASVPAPPQGTYQAVTNAFKYLYSGNPVA